MTSKAQNASHMILIYSKFPRNTAVLSDVEGRLDFDMFRALPRAVTVQSIELLRALSLVAPKSQDVIIGENGVKCTHGFSVLFLTTTGESTVTTK